MRKHNGMRPQDIVILLKMIAKTEQQWQNKDLAQELFISQSEISDSLNRSALAGLVDNNKKKKVHRGALMEFIEHGLHYVFPAQTMGIAAGIPTAHSHLSMKEYFSSDLDYVWQDYENTRARGLVLEPLYKEAPKAAMKDEMLYEMLAMIDVIRVGRVREWRVATERLSKLILHESQN